MKLIYLGVFFILIGFTINEFSVVYYLPPIDGEISNKARLIIRLFDGACIILGFLTIFFRPMSIILDFIRAGIGELKLFPQQGKVLLDILFTIMISLFLIAQVSHLISAVSDLKTNQGIIRATDVDAANAVVTVGKTNWFNNNEWFVYGPLYYRLAHSFQSVLPDISYTSGNEAMEEKGHFSLLIISVISLNALSFLLASLFIAQLRFRIYATLLINSALLNNHIWSLFVFRAHPDILFSFLCGLFVYLVFKMKTSEQDNYLYLVALVGGAALSTKLIFLFFLPGLLFIEIPPFNKKRLLRLSVLYLMIGLFYLVVGLPQNLLIHKSVGFLIYQSDYSLSPSWDSFKNWWIQLTDQGFQPFIIIFATYIILGRKSSLEASRNIKCRIFLFTFTPFLFLFSRTIISYKEHYTLPFVTVLLVATIILLHSGGNNFFSTLQNLFMRSFVRYSSVLILLFIIERSYGIVPRSLSSTLQSVKGPRTEISSIYERINSHLKKKDFLLLDPYVPYNSSYSDSYHVEWNPTVNILSQYEPDVLVLNKKYHRRWIEGSNPTNYVLVKSANWQEVRGFYSLFNNRTEITDPSDQVWQRTFESPFGIEIWERK